MSTTLAGLSSRSDTFPSCTLAVGVHVRRFTCLVNGDQNRHNDTIIDTIVVRPYTDAAALAVLSPTGWVWVGDTVHPQARVANLGATAQSVPVRFLLDSTLVQTETVSLVPYETTAVDFSALTPAAGLRTVRFVTALAFDDSVHNDTVADTVRVRGPDVAALAVLAPVDTVTFEDAVVPSVRVANLCGAAVGLPVRFRLDGVTVESESVSLAPHETTVVEFSARLLAAGTRAVEFVAALGGDDYHLNDTVRDSVRVLGGDYWRELAAPGIDSARLCWDRGEYVYAADRNSATMTRYAIAADTWETIAAPPITRVRGLTAHHGVVYVLGQPLTDAPTQLCRYVAEADTWVAEQVAVQLTSTADDAALVSDQGPSIYVITGSPLDAAGDVVRYFPDEDTVIDIDGPGFSHQGAADWSGSSLYAVQRNNTLKRYDSLTETWTTVANPQGGSGWVYGPTMACDPVLDRLYAFVPGIGFGLPGKEKSGKAGGTDQSYSFWERQNDGSAWVLRAIPPALDTGAGMCFGPVQAYLLDGAGGFWRYRPLPVQDVAATLAFAPDTVPAESAFSVAGVVRNSDSAQRTVPVELVVGTYCDTANVGMAGRACDTLQFTGVQPSEHGFLTARLRVMPGFSDARPANDTAWASVYRRHQLDVSADSIAVPTDSWPFDSIVQPAAWVQNRSDETLSVQVRCWIDSAYADSCVLWLPPLSTARADSFDTCHLRVGLHVVQFAVSCAGDVEPDNDSIFDTIEVVTCGYWREVQNSPCESPIRLAGDGPLVYAMPDSGTGFYCYDPEKDDWEELTSSPLVRTWSVAARDGFVYALGTPRSACDRSAPTSSRTRDQAEDVIAEYEVAGDRWRTLADRLPSTPGPGSCVFIDKAGLLYLLADGDSGNFFCTDTAVEEWQARASLPAGQKLPSYTSGACDAAGDCYAVSDIAGVLFRYDSKNDTWLALDSVVGWVGVMPDPPDASALAPGGNGKPYLYWPAEEPPGGTGFYEFDLGNDVWTAKPAFPALVPEPALAGAGSELYLSLGDGSRTFARFRLEPGLDVAATEVIVPDTVGYDSAILVSGVVQNCCAVPAWYYAQLEVPGDSTQTSGLRYVEPWQYDTVAFDACTLPPGEQELVLTAVCAGDVNHENDQQTKLVYVLGPWRPLEDVFAQGRLDADGEGSVFASDRHTSSVSQYSIAAGEWTDLAAPPLDSGIIDLSYDDGQLYVLGPVCADSRTGKPRGRQRDGDATGWAIYRWDLQDAEWKLVTDTMPEDEPTVNSWIVARDSSVYYGPGYGGHFFRHDDQGGWTKLAQVPDSILPPCAVDWDRDNDIIYLMALTSDTSVFYAYSIDRDSWSALPALPSSVYGDGLGLAVEPDGHVAALVHGDETSAGFYEWKQEADGWYLLPSAPWALADGAALTCLGAQAYALTGDDAVQPSTFWCYDPGLNDRPGQRTDGAAGGRVTPRIFYLYEPVPTPFAARTLIRWQVPVATHVVLRVHDAVGRLVRTLVDAEVQPGCYSSVWDGADAAGRRVRAGVYFCALEVDGRRLSRKVVLMAE
jgi:hypothetical protein